MYDMNRTSRICLQTIVGLVAFIALLGYAGSYEYAEQICYTMSDEAYHIIVAKLGDDASQKEIAAEYMKNRTYYESIK